MRPCQFSIFSRLWVPKAPPMPPTLQVMNERGRAGGARAVWPAMDCKFVARVFFYAVVQFVEEQALCLQGARPLGDLGQ